MFFDNCDIANNNLNKNWQTIAYEGKRYAEGTSLRLKLIKMKYVINKTQYSHSRMDIMNIV